MYKKMLLKSSLLLVTSGLIIVAVCAKILDEEEESVSRLELERLKQEIDYINTELLKKGEGGDCVSRLELERLREECVGVKLTECVDRQEFESLKEEFARVKSELEKRDKDIQSLKRVHLADALEDKLELLHYKLDEVYEDIQNFQSKDTPQTCEANNSTAPHLSLQYFPTSCSELAEIDPKSHSGYYWLATQYSTKSKVYCDFDLTSAHNPAHSCKQLAQQHPSIQSGHYWVHNGSGDAIEAYCEMQKNCCGSTEGWMRVSHFDMTDPDNFCPKGFRLFPGPKRLCTRDTSHPGCASIYFGTHGVLYSRVCGKVIGYQNERPDAFAQYHLGHSVNIDEPYVDGVSVTYGSPNRRHIWTFAGAKDEVTDTHFVTCPCTKAFDPFTGTIPPFVRNDYFCDTGSRNAAENRLYYEDALWDGKGCGPTSSCCQFNSPPYFCKVLPQATTDDIEVRLCEWFAGAAYNEDTPIEAIELFVQ